MTGEVGSIFSAEEQVANRDARIKVLELKVELLGEILKNSRHDKEMYKKAFLELSELEEGL